MGDEMTFMKTGNYASRNFALAVIACLGTSSRLAFAETPAGGFVGEAGAEHTNFLGSNVGVTHFNGTIGYGITRQFIVYGGIGIDRLDDDDAQNDGVTNAWGKAGIRGEVDLGGVALDLGYGFTVDPTTDEIVLNQRTNWGHTAELRGRVAVSPTLYVFGGTMRGGGLVGSIYSTAGLPTSGAGATATTLELGEDASITIFTIDTSVGLGAALSPALKVEFDLPVWSAIGVAFDDGTSNGMNDEADGQSLVIGDDFLAGQVSAWHSAGALEFGARVGYWHPTYDGTSGDGVVRLGISARGWF